MKYFYVDPIHTALDPTYKVAYTKDKWEPQYFKDGMSRLEKVVSLYHIDTSIDQIML
jgi:hypothetical protein